jgi:hypothetical protein
LIDWLRAWNVPRSLHGNDMFCRFRKRVDLLGKPLQKDTYLVPTQRSSNGSQKSLSWLLDPILILFIVFVLSFNYEILRFLKNVNFSATIKISSKF